MLVEGIVLNLLDRLTINVLSVKISRKDSVRKRKHSHS